MWDLPRPGLEPMSPALAGGFLTTLPPGKPMIPSLMMIFHCPIQWPLAICGYLNLKWNKISNLVPHSSYLNSHMWTVATILGQYMYRKFPSLQNAELDSSEKSLMKSSSLPLLHSTQLFRAWSLHSICLESSNTLESFKNDTVSHNAKTSPQIPILFKLLGHL